MARRMWRMADGRATGAIMGLLGAGALLVGRLSMPAFLILAVLMLLGTAYAASRWPRATLVAVALTTLLDPGVAVRLLPPVLADGPIGVSEPLLAVTGLAALTRVRRAALTAALRDPTTVLIALFALASVASALVNAVPLPVATFGIVMTIDAVAIYVVWRALEPPPEAGVRAIAATVTAGLIVALFGIAQVLLAPSLFGFGRIASRPGDVGHVTSLLGNPNLLAQTLVLFLPFPIFSTIRAPERRFRILAAGVTVVLVVALVLTGSRGSWLAAGIGLGLGALLLDVRALPTAIALSVVAMVIVVASPIHLVGTDRVIGTPTASPSARSGAESSPQPDPPPTATVPDPNAGLTSDEIRLKFLSDGLRIIRDHPVLGVGPGRYGGAVATIFPSAVYEEYGAALGRFRTVHNYWLHLAGEVGVLGLSLFATAIAGLFLRMRKAAREANTARFVILAGAASAAVVASVNGFTEMGFEGNTPAVLLWLILGVGAAMAPDARLGLIGGGDRQP